jgi:glycosyltransferase involved in cell wall biosynthesis
MLHICIVNLAGYPLYNPECRNMFGGAEVQAYLIAKELAKTEKFKVSVIVSDHGQVSPEIYDGARVYAHSGYRNRGVLKGSIFPRLRWWWRRSRRALSFRLQQRKRWHIGETSISTSALAIYREVDAQVYIVRGYTSIATEVAFFCRQQGIPFIFLACTPIDYLDPTQARFDHQYVINNAALHIVQTENQRQDLWSYYSYHSVKIPNLVDVERRFPKDMHAQTILWIGKFNDVKRPELVAQLAQELPEYQFVLISNQADDDYYRRVQPVLKRVKNINCIEHVPYSQIETFFARAQLFISTSIYEGMPNTFLQAIKYGVPVISLNVDPEEMLSLHKCGIVCGGDLMKMKDSINFLIKTPEVYIHFSDNCVKFLDYYRMTDIIHNYELAIQSVLDGNIQP